MVQDFTLFAIVQNGRLAYEALLLAASVARSSPDTTLTLLEPQPGPLWPQNPTLHDDLRNVLLELGAEIVPFENSVFGARYPHGNKIEALKLLPGGKPFLFLDTDTLVTGALNSVPFDFDRPTASLRRENTWPKVLPNGPSLHQIWAALYNHFGIDFAASQDQNRDFVDWQRYLYFNAGFFFGRCPKAFGDTFLHFAREIEDNPPEELAGQKLDPWLDQIALPLVIQKMGGGRDTLPPGLMDGEVTCHYRTLPLLYARESADNIAFLEDIAGQNRLKKHLKAYDPAREMIYRGKGREVSKLFRDGLPENEQAIRKRLKAAGLWMR